MILSQHCGMKGKPGKYLNDLFRLRFRLGLNYPNGSASACAQDDPVPARQVP